MGQSARCSQGSPAELSVRRTHLAATDVWFVAFPNEAETFSAGLASDLRSKERMR